MEGLEVSAKTVEEAIQQALDKLGLSQEEVEIVVLKKGRQGILGLGFEEARVRVIPLPKPSEEEKEVSEIAREVLEEILTLLKVDARVEVQEIDPEEASPESPVVALEVKGEDVGVLIGRRGQTLASLQHIVRLIVAHRLKARQPLVVDVEGYKRRHYNALRQLALRLAERVESTGQSATLEPMLANERRIVHIALAGNPDVVTQSLGDGETRKVIIAPRSKG